MGLNKIFKNVFDFQPLARQSKIEGRTFARDIIAKPNLKNPRAGASRVFQLNETKLKFRGNVKSKNKLKINKNILATLILFLILPNISALIISEIMYAPLESEFYNEYIEIYNDGESYMDITNWTLCGDALLPGYIDHGDSEKLKLNDSVILPKGNYAIITDGESGTEVYSNFNVQQSALVLHVNAASLCGGLVNSGETIDLKDPSGNLADSISYDSILANNNDKSLQKCSSWIEGEPNPGKENSCQTQNTQTQIQTNQTIQNNNENLQINNQTQNNSNNATISNTSNPASETNQQENIAKEENSEAIMLNSNADSKDIKSEDNTEKLDKIKLDKNDYARYILTAFVFLLAVLFLLKKIFKRKYQNEFKNQ